MQIKQVKFTQSARKHRIGRASVLYVINDSEPTITETERGEEYAWVGEDERGRELEITAVVGQRDGALLVIHVMPTVYRKR